MGEMEPNMFLVHFSKAEDIEKVLGQTPWNIREQLMVFKPWSSKLTIPEVKFYSEAMWIQVHGLPWDRIGKSTIQLIGLKLGKLLEIDKLEYRDQDHRHFLRLQVELNLWKPLVGGSNSGMKNWLIFVMAVGWWVIFKNSVVILFLMLICQEWDLL